MTISHAALDEHLSNDLLVRFLDDELSGAEAIHVEIHLVSCEECRRRQSDLRLVSDGFEAFMHSLQPSVAEGSRRGLISGMDSSKHRFQVNGTGKTLARFGWALAAAATIAIGVSYIPFSRVLTKDTDRTANSAAGRPSQTGSPFEIDGETFQYLPYSNPDLPLGGSHVVQMQVPLSSLADAGVLVEPMVNRVAMPDRAVLANVLLGVDGQPIGVHVLSED